jgi:hypothetical protein
VDFDIPAAREQIEQSHAVGSATGATDTNDYSSHVIHPPLLISEHHPPFCFEFETEPDCFAVIFA